MRSNNNNNYNTNRKQLGKYLIHLAVKEIESIPRLPMYNITEGKASSTILQQPLLHNKPIYHEVPNEGYKYHLYCEKCANKAVRVKSEVRIAIKNQDRHSVLVPGAPITNYSAL